MSHNVRTTNLQGEAGADYYADSSAHTGNWRAITALEGAVASLVAENWSGTLTSVPIPAGVTIYAKKFTSITLASGKVVAYRHS